MENKEKLFCKNCGNLVHYERETKQFCSDACKDRYYYSKRRIEKKHASFSAQIKDDPESKARLHEEVLAKLSRENHPILLKISQVEGYNKEYARHIALKQASVDSLREEVKPLESLQQEYEDFIQRGQTLKAWIEQETEALAGQSRFVQMERYSALSKEESQFRIWQMDHLLRLSKQEKSSQNLQAKREALAGHTHQLNELEKGLQVNKDWLSNTFLEYNMKRVADLKILPLPRPAKRKKRVEKKGEAALVDTKHGKLPLPAHPQPEGVASEAKAPQVPGKMEEKKRLAFLLGTDLSEEPLYWQPLEQSNPHLLAIGKSGSGKTSLLGICCQGAYKLKVPVLAFDYDGGLLDERLCMQTGIPLRELIGAKVIDAAKGIGINPLSLPNPAGEPSQGNYPYQVNYQDIAQGLCESLSTIFELGEVQKGWLLAAIESAYHQKGFRPGGPDDAHLEAPTLGEVWAILQENSGNGAYAHMVLRLKTFLGRNLFTSPDTLTIAELFERNTFINLSGLPSESSKAALTRMLLGKIYEHMLRLGPARQDQLRLLIILDEAHFLSKDGWVNALIKGARKFGVGLLLASHSSKDFSESTLNMVGTRLALRLDGSDAKRMAESMGVVERKEKKSLEERILNQDKMHGVIRNDAHSPYTFFRLLPLHERS